MRFGTAFVLAALATAASITSVSAQTAPPAAAKPAATEKTIGPEGKWTTKDGSPTYNIQADGTMDWFTYSGFRRYHSECHVCHGPDGEGSTYAPALKDSVKTINYAEFYGIVVGGKQELGGGENKVMPALGDNKNVMCYIDDIYVYLRARSGDAIGRGRPGKHEDKPPQAADAEQACLADKN